MFAPGVLFLAQRGVRLAVPFVLLAVLRRVPGLDVALSHWTWLVLAAASVPLYGVCCLALRNHRHRREAEAAGARLAPTSDVGKLPGNLDLLIRMQKIWQHGYPGDGLSDVLDETGPVVNLNPMFENIVLTTCPEHVKEILATNFTGFVKGERFQLGMSSVLGTGVFNSDGEMWKFHRAMTRPFFSRDRISHFEIFDRHAEAVIFRIKQRNRTGYAIDFQDLIGRFTMDSATDFLFGSSLHSLDANLSFPHNAIFTRPVSESANAQQAMQFSSAFNASMLHISNRARVGWVWPLLEMFRDRTTDPMKLVSAYIDPIIHQAVQRKQLSTSLTHETKNQEALFEGRTLLDELLDMTSDFKVLKDETLNILLAGKDTTQWTLTVAVYFLATHPEVNARLRDEILEQVGPSRRPTYDDIKDMKFLRAVLNETMRLYPSVPFNVRESVNATVWPSPDPNEKPIYIPAGTQTPYSVLLMHRRKDLWGPDAEEFDPDRFLDHRLQKYLLKNSFQFLPFNAGPRICLGQQFAYNEMSFILIRLLQNFSSFSLDQEAFPPESRPPAEWAAFPGRKGIELFKPRMHLTMYSEGGMWLKATEAQ
ncbi:unnamed protein product [Mycena citricolor]|uniref:Cytochrome P450 n=1 Tax=Mycena citricolor TaxID=2018698 RepID=A0AAD2H8Q7_9AGAR|nr:unnamed protein product [Mycena citricolor]CAK5284229.1 unnamed protein product [Mycena citricolor]